MYSHCPPCWTCKFTLHATMCGTQMEDIESTSTRMPGMINRVRVLVRYLDSCHAYSIAQLTQPMSTATRNAFMMTRLTFDLYILCIQCIVVVRYVGGCWTSSLLSRLTRHCRLIWTKNMSTLQLVLVLVPGTAIMPECTTEDSRSKPEWSRRTYDRTSIVDFSNIQGQSQHVFRPPIRSCVVK